MVGERRALREAGRAARVLDVDGVVELQRRAALAQLVVRDAARRRPAAPSQSGPSSRIVRSSAGQRGRTSSTIAA